ncbi:MAG: signal peptide peptidase SppA [Rhizobiaceae bacterium]|nr:signal peptide peptidase SppA [Rhizobiaceae bacterium]
MTFTDIAERRQLRRKLSFWRVVAFLLLAAAIIGLGLLFSGDQGGKARPHVAHVDVTGMIVDDTELVERLDQIAANDSVKALIVSINSPGGTTYGGEMIHKALRRVAAKKPVVSDIRTLAASAGYMIASAGDHIVAGETSITGSIGVIFQYPQIKPLLDKIGVSLEEIKSAPLKAEPSPFHTPPEAAKTAIQAMVDDSFAWFVDLVAERRKISRADALRLADGRVFTGRQAVGEKLVDELGGVKEIRAYLETRKVSADLPVVDWKPKPSGTNYFLGSLAADVADRLGLGWLTKAAAIKNMSEDKLLLDGLVSVWHFDGK